MGYFGTALRGISWMGGLRIIVRGLAILKIAVLARILTPEQFGVYGIALLVLGFLEVITETGINIFLIQEKEGTEKYLNSAWVVSILRGLLISILIILSIPLIVSFFGYPEVKNLLYIVSLIALVRGLINPMVVSFQKKLEFNKVFMFQSSLFLVDAFFAILIGVITKSESALLFGMLASVSVEVILSFIIFKDKPKLKIEMEKVKEVINRGKWITGAGFFSYLFQNIDNIIIAKLLGANSLGLYQQAYRISTLPVSEVGEVFNKVTFPVYVEINDDKKRLRKAFLKTLFIILGIVIPFGLIIIFFSRPLIILFLGENWLSIEPTLKILAIFGVLKAVLNSSYSLFLAIKKQEIVMLSELFGILGIGISIIPLVQKFGILGAGYATIIGALFCLPVILINLKNVKE